jgi:hypothetical protein
MITLFRALVLPNLRYCCQLWSPLKAVAVQKLEAVQRTFTNRISGIRELNLNCWERLKHLGLYSQERRERYIILNTWNMITGLAPNFESQTSRIVTRYNERRGRLCRIPPFNNRAAARVQTLREGSLSVEGPTLFNALLKALGGGEFTLAIFKRRLDNWLRKIPD